MAEKSVVRTDAAPAPFRGAPYSQAIRAGDFVFVAGQAGFRPEDSSLVGSTIEAQTEQTIANLRAILEAAGSSLDRIVKTTVYLSTLDDFQAMNEVYAERFGTHKPARSTVGAALLRGAKVEIDCIAVRRNV